MKLQNLLLTLGLVSSASAMATHYRMGPLTVDSDSLVFLGACNEDNTLIDFNDNGFDALFLDMESFSAGGRDRQACVIKFTAVPDHGYTAAVSEFGIAGVSQIFSKDGTTNASLRHTLAGTVGDAALASYQYGPGSELEDVVLRKEIDNLNYVSCGKEIVFKTTIAIGSTGENASIVIDDGATQGEQSSFYYKWAWKYCK